MSLDIDFMNDIVRVWPLIIDELRSNPRLYAIIRSCPVYFGGKSEKKIIICADNPFFYTQLTQFNDFIRESINKHIDFVEVSIVRIQIHIREAISEDAMLIARGAQSSLEYDSNGGKSLDFGMLESRWGDFIDKIGKTNQSLMEEVKKCQIQPAKGLNIVMSAPDKIVESVVESCLEKIESILYEWCNSPIKIILKEKGFSYLSAPLPPSEKFEMDKPIVRDNKEPRTDSLSTKSIPSLHSDQSNNPVLKNPPTNGRKIRTNATISLNNTSFGNSEIIEYDGVRFRSPPEVSIYKELKIRNILFFPNALAILGGKDLKREPDFLICYKGKWGILEVMGETYHTNATKDHDRARLFKDYGIKCIEFYDAMECHRNPHKIVDDFLIRLDIT